MLQKPVITSWNVIVTLEGTFDIQANCVGHELNPLPVWLRAIKVKSIEVTWQANYVNPVTLPGNEYTYYLSEAHVGVA